MLLAEEVVEETTNQATEPTITDDWTTRRVEVQRVITPELALVMLKRVIGKNRKLSPSKVYEYVKLIHRGEWKDTAESIKFDATGTLVDGANRLTAIVASDETITNDVAFGLPPSAFVYIDTGRNRTANNGMEMNGVRQYTKRTTGAITWILRYLTLGSNGLSVQLGQHNGKVDNAARTAFFEKQPEIADGFGAELKSIHLPESVGMAAYWLGCQVNEVKTKEFFEGAFSGANLNAEDPRLMLRTAMQNIAARPGKIRPDVPMALTLKALRAYLDDKTLTTLRWKPSNGTPRLVDGFNIPTEDTAEEKAGRAHVRSVIASLGV